MNPELHLSQLSLAESCKFLDIVTSDTVVPVRGSERRFSSTSIKKLKDEKQAIFEEKDPEAGESKGSEEEDEGQGQGQDQEQGQVTLPNRAKAERKGWKRYIGLVLTIVHVIAFTLSALVVKLLPDFHPFSIAFWRFQGIFLPSVCVLAYHGAGTCKKQQFAKSGLKVEEKKPKPLFDQLWPPTNKKNIKNLLLLTFRCWAGASALFMYFFALKYITIADSFVISAAGPCFVSILAFIFLKEKLGIFTICLTLTTLAGVMLISRPPFLTGAEQFDDKILLGFGIEVCCTLIGSVSFVLLRYLKNIHFAVVSTSFGAWGTVLSLVFAFSFNAFHVPSTRLELLYLVGIGCLTFIAQISITKALQTEEASVVSLLKTTNIIFAFVWQLIFLGVKPDLYSVLGAAIVLIGCTGSVFRRWLSQLPENHRHRQAFWFVLK